MALPDSTLARACRTFADFLSANIQATQNSVRVMVGHPALAAPGESDHDHRLNLFFHRFDSSGFDADMLPGDIAWMRLHCLVTSFAAAEGNTSAGENDLRLLGEVMRVFHEKPILDAVDIGGETVRLQATFQPLTVDEINRLWSTQGDLAYRPSVEYEVALAPIIPNRRTVGSPLVGAVGEEVRGRIGNVGAFTGQAATVPFQPAAIDTAREDWTPQIALISDGHAVSVLAFRVGSPELVAFAPRAAIAGLPGANVLLRWELWDATAGWRTQDGPAATVQVAAIDPDAPPAGAAAPLPFTNHGGQAVLYAVRRYKRAADGPAALEVEARSNPVLVTLYQGAGP